MFYTVNAPFLSKYNNNILRQSAFFGTEEVIVLKVVFVDLYTLYPSFVCYNKKSGPLNA